MKKLFAVIALAGLLTACNNEEAAKKEAADKATADSVRVRGYNSINIRSNYQVLEIRSPKEILEYED